MTRKIPKSLKLSLRGSVEIQAQHRPNRLKKPRTESVGTDQLGRVPSRLGPIGEAGYVNRYADRFVGRPIGCRNREAVRIDIP